MDLKEANKWWMKAIKKESQRYLTQPKSPKGSWFVPTNFKTTIASEGHARRRRSA